MQRWARLEFGKCKVFFNADLFGPMALDQWLLTFGFIIAFLIVSFDTIKKIAYHSIK